MNRWQYIESLRKARAYLGVVAYKDRIYAVGGCNHSQTHDTVEVYLPDEDRWASVAPMNIRRSNFGIVIVNDYMYVAGGWDGMQSITTVERYDLKVDAWTQVGFALEPSERQFMSHLISVGQLGQCPSSHIARATWKLHHLRWRLRRRTEDEKR